MANFHPRPHPNTAAQLQESLDQLQESLVMPLQQRGAEVSGGKPQNDNQDDSAPMPPWEDALEAAAADIDNFFKHGQKN